ncbi:hypothetical protein VTI74DRAFT_1404 [Chaetomium olivicolor]
MAETIVQMLRGQPFKEEILRASVWGGFTLAVKTLLRSGVDVSTPNARQPPPSSLSPAISPIAAGPLRMLLVEERQDTGKLWPFLTPLDAANGDTGNKVAVEWSA